MPEAVDMEAYRKSSQKYRTAAHLPGVLKDGDGDGTSGGMEARVAKLEADVSHLVKQVDRIDARTEPMPADIAVIKATMAGKGFIVTALGISLTLLVAALTILSKLGLLAAG